MATLSIRNLPERVQQRLRIRAARSGRSMEAEAREILTEACAPRRSTAEELQSFVDSLFGARKPSGMVKELIARRRREAAEE